MRSTQSESRHLEDLLDGLDDLFDDKSDAIEFYAKLADAVAVLGDTAHARVLAEAERHLQGSLNEPTRAARRESALDKTNTLRLYLAEVTSPQPLLPTGAAVQHDDED